MIIYQSKDSTEKSNSHIQTTAYLFRDRHVRFSQKRSMKCLRFQTNVIIFQNKASTEKTETVLTFDNTLTYTKKRLFMSE